MWHTRSLNELSGVYGFVIVIFFLFSYVWQRHAAYATHAYPTPTHFARPIYWLLCCMRLSLVPQQQRWPSHRDRCGRRSLNRCVRRWHTTVENAPHKFSFVTENYDFIDKRWATHSSCDCWIRGAEHTSTHYYSSIDMQSENRNY